MRKYYIILAMLMVGVFMVMGGTANAVSIAPSLATYPVAGEAEFTAFFPPGAPDIGYVDWIVFNPSDYSATAFSGLVFGITGSSILGEYLYVYQIETTATSDVEDLTIYFTTSLATGAGTYFSDLDTWHNAVNFPILGAPIVEGEILPQLALQPMTFGPLWNPTNITYDFDGTLDGGEESEILWITSPWKAAYRPAGISNTAMLGGYVPAPVPEPSSLLLLGSGLLGVALLGVARRRKITV